MSMNSHNDSQIHPFLYLPFKNCICFSINTSHVRSIAVLKLHSVSFYLYVSTIKQPPLIIIKFLCAYKFCFSKAETAPSPSFYWTICVGYVDCDISLLTMPRFDSRRETHPWLLVLIRGLSYRIVTPCSNCRNSSLALYYLFNFFLQLSRPIGWNK